jgi:hypothetical protein
MKSTDSSHYEARLYISSDYLNTHDGIVVTVDLITRFNAHYFHQIGSLFFSLLLWSKVSSAFKMWISEEVIYYKCTSGKFFIMSTEFIKTFQIEAIIALITKMALVFS